MRHAFTLMEMMVSVVLIVMITLFLSEAVTSLRFSNVKLKEHDAVDENRSRLMKMLYEDIFITDTIDIFETENKRYDVLQLFGAKSYYGIAGVHVLYYVKKENRALIRLESPKAIKLPVPYEDRFVIKSDVLLKNVSDFSIVRGKASVPVKQQASSKSDTNTTAAKAKQQGSILLFVASQQMPKSLILEIDRL